MHTRTRPPLNHTVGDEITNRPFFGLAARMANSKVAASPQIFGGTQ